MNEHDKDILKKLLKSKKLNKYIQNLQNIVNSDDGGITGITISSGDKKVEFKKESENE